MAESGKRQRRLSDEYSFAGYRARASVRGAFGDPNVRIVRLDRRAHANVHADSQSGDALARGYGGQIGRHWLVIIVFFVLASVYVPA
jgi:hypothetical protein